MTGSISRDLDAVLSIIVSGISGAEETVQAVIDTGFNGYLTLPANAITTLALPFHSMALATLADGSQIAIRKYEATVKWHDQDRDVLVLEAEGGPLLGMALLRGSRITLDVLDDGGR